MARGRVRFLDDLVQLGRYPEALTLCLTYVDSFATWLYWPRAGVGRNFSEALAEHEPQPFLALMHPLQFVRALTRLKEPWKERAARIAAVFPGPDYSLLDHATFFARMADGTSAPDLTALREEAWRGTVASIAYEYLRNPSVHTFAGNWSVLFERTSQDGTWAGVFGIDRLLPVLRTMVDVAEQRSLDTGKWFGDDAIVNAT